MSTNNIVQTVTLTADINVPNRTVPDSLKDLAVVEAEIERMFGGGGSKAELKVVFDDFLSDAEKEQLDSFAQSGPRDDSFIEYDNPASRRANQMEIIVDVETTLQFGSASQSGTERLFRGTVVKVTEADDRTVTFSALDRRHELNRTMVQLDVAKPTPVEDVVQQILDNKNNTGLQLDPSQYEIDSTSNRTSQGRTPTISTRDRQSVLINNKTYGVDAHATTFEVLQDLARKASATVHIDTNNVLHFTQFPEHKRYTSETMPPIIEWSSGDNETENDVIIQSPYDQTGTGRFTTTARDVTGAKDGAVPASEVTKEMNVFDRNAVENARNFELMSTEMLKESATIRCVGDPAIQPYDTFVLDESVVDGFASIGYGQYMATTVRHIINNNDGYLVELELGTDPRELFEQFSGQAAESFTRAQEAREQDAASVGAIFGLFQPGASTISEITDELT